MSRFVLVRGWIECSFDQVPVLRALGTLDPDIAGLFHVDDDEGEIALEWQLAEGNLTETGRA